MTLLGCVPVENHAETGSNVKSAVESRTEKESLKRRLDVIKKGMMVTEMSSHLMISWSFHHINRFAIQKQICANEHKYCLFRED